MADPKPSKYPQGTFGSPDFPHALMTEVACRLAGISLPELADASERLLAICRAKIEAGDACQTVEEVADILMCLLPKSTTEPGVN